MSRSKPKGSSAETVRPDLLHCGDPFSMEGIAFNVECGDLFIGDLEAGRVEV